MLNQNSIVLITGANSGIGKATAIELAKTSATIVMACRSLERGKQAKSDIQEASGSEKIDLMICDLGSMKSIREFCSLFRSKYPRLNVLINNAAVILTGYHRTEDGFELQFGVNHLGHFLLTNELHDLIIKSAPARIINVSSGAHKFGAIHLDDIHLEKRFTFMRAYAQSKLANVLFTYHLAEKLAGTGVTVNCLHPGAVATQLGINRENGFGRGLTRLLKPFFLTPETGAETSIYLATSEEVSNITGKYFRNKKSVPSSKRSYDKEMAKKLWELSEKLTDSR
ncbi:MAG TPA: SDR family oxidoreductase [Bacteroidales bacterium]|nr:SDR family oxidoreductase [Bacteroidales bacterium]